MERKTYVDFPRQPDSRIATIKSESLFMGPP
jgi:hypothetical protein